MGTRQRERLEQTETGGSKKEKQGSAASGAWTCTSEIQPHAPADTIRA